MQRDRQRRPGSLRSAAAVHADDSTDVVATATTGDFSHEWRICPEHPWYGVSVLVTRHSATCIPPLDGTPNHSVELAA